MFCIWCKISNKRGNQEAYNKGARVLIWMVRGTKYLLSTQKCDFDKLQRMSKKDRFKCGLPV